VHLYQIWMLPERQNLKPAYDQKNFRVAGGDDSIEKKFAAEAAAARLVGTPGHRSVGGMRVSLYNAVTREAVEALTAFMREFHRARG